MAVNWSDLMPEMLGNIAEKCMSMNLKDFAMFTCVCSSWRGAAAFVKSTVVLHQQISWLVLPCDLVNNNNKDSYSDKRNLFDLGNNKCYTLSLLEAYKKKCYGTGSEWILMVGLEREIHLVNPLTRALLPLPSYNTFLHPPWEKDDDGNDDDVDDDDEGDTWFRGCFIHRAFVLSLTRLLVVVIYGEFGDVAIATQEDTKWTPIDVNGLCDVTYSPTLGMMLFLRYSGHVECCDLHHLYDHIVTDVPISLVNYVLPPHFISEEPHRCLPLHKKLYLLDSFGNILLIKRVYDKDFKVTCNFDAYKLNMRTKEWKEVQDLGDVVLFIGSSPATSVQASNFPTSCKPNCIYLNDDIPDIFRNILDDNGEFVYVPGGGDMGLYNLASGTIEWFYPRDDYLSNYSVPVWLMPKL